MCIRDRIQQGRLDEAIAELQTAVAIQPGHAGARNNLGAAFMQAGRMAEALGEYWKVLETQPENVDALNNLAWALATGPQVALRDGVSAVALAQKAVRLSGGENPRMLRTLAAAEAEAGRFVGAAETARQALQLADVYKRQKPPLAIPLFRPRGMTTPPHSFRTRLPRPKLKKPSGPTIGSMVLTIRTKSNAAP